MSRTETLLSRQSDAELVAISRQGSTEAFGELVQRYQDRVFNLAYRLTGSQDEAADAVQEAFLRAYRGRESFRGESAFYTWLFRITVNTVRSRQRHRAIRPVERSLDAEVDTDRGSRPNPAAGLKARVPDPAEEASRSEHKLVVERALAKLEPAQRNMIVLRDIEGRNYAEIANLLGCPRGTVKSRLHRARMALKELLAPVLAATFDAGD